MQKPHYFLVALFIVLIFGMGLAVTSAQDDSCSFDDGKIVETIQMVCPPTGENEVCYGNFEVNVVTQGDVPEDFHFINPGDNAQLEFIRSLFLSSLDPQRDRWGIAQMYLLANLTQGAEEITILLFGDVSVDNEVAATTKLNVVPTVSANVRNVPSLDSIILRSVPAQEPVEAVGRLEDTSWIRVIVPETGALGWISVALLSLQDESTAFEDLPIHTGSSPYFGPMRAMSYRSGTSTTCSTFGADGMLIQTPQGQARITMLINEVSIEMVSTNQFGAAAFVQANPEDGMSISMLTGSANVEAEGTAFFVNANMRTIIPLNQDFSAAGVPSAPSRYDTQTTQDIALLPLVIDSSVPLGTVEAGTDSDANTSSTSATGNTNTSNGGGTSESGNPSRNTGNNNSAECNLPGAACQAPPHSGESNPGNNNPPGHSNNSNGNGNGNGK